MIVLIIGLASYLVWFVSLGLGGGWSDVSGKPVGPDHLAFHAAAQITLEGKGDQLFDYPEVTLIRDKQRELTQLDDFLNPYRNPPFATLPYQLTASLSYPLSFLLWVLIGVTGLALSIGLLVPRASFWYVLGLSLCFYPTFATVAFGQNSLVSLTIISIGCWSYLRGWHVACGLCIGLLLYKPQLVLGFALWALLDFWKLRKVWLGFILTAVALTIISITLLPKESQAWLSNLRGISAYDAFDYFNLTNATGFFSLILGDNRKIGKGCGLLVLGLGVMVFGRFWRKYRENPEVMFAGCVYLSLLISPHTMVYEWSLALVSLWLVWYRVEIDKTQFRRGLVFLVVGLLAGPPLSQVMLNKVGFAIQFGWIGPIVAGCFFWKALPTLSPLPLRERGRGEG